MLALIDFLSWRDVDPKRFPFDPAPAAAIAERHVLHATGGDRGRNAPARGAKRGPVAEAIDRELVAAYGPWAAGWNWAASEPGGGGPVRGWCCADDSVLAKGDAGAQATVDRVVGALTELRGFLEELAARFAELRDATATLPLERGIEHVAAALLPAIVERTRAEDAWYATFARVLGWYAESIGAPPEVHTVIGEIVRGRFHSWSEPYPDVAAAACMELGDGVRRAAADARVHDALSAWRRSRVRAFDPHPTVRPRLPLGVDAHRAFIEGPERARDPVRAQRMSAALDACRASAARGEPLTFARLATWQALVLGVDVATFRTGPAYARGGRVMYALTDGTQAELEAALAESDDHAVSSVVRAARAYLDVCFFHPFMDGNGRAARLALEHILTRAGLGLIAVAPIFVVARAADDVRGAWCLAHVLEQLIGTR